LQWQCIRKVTEKSELKKLDFSMIDKAAKAYIKSILGYRSAPLIQEELNSCNEYNKAGKPYSRGHITNVMNGENHEIIETAIYRVVKKRLKIQKKRAHLFSEKSSDKSADQ